MMLKKICILLLFINYSWAQQDSADLNLIHFAFESVGKPYRGGTIGPNSFDCSGFTTYVFKEIYNVELPRRSNDQATLGRFVSKSKAQVGDLIFFKGSNKYSSRIGHVGIVIANTDGELEFIHASSSKGITIDRTDVAYYKERFMTVRRLEKSQSTSTEGSL